MLTFYHNRAEVAARPAFRLVALFDEAVEYVRPWRLPFHSLAYCAEENPDDPSWVEVEGRHLTFAPGQVHFTAAMTPMRIRYTPANHHLCIHFRYEFCPGVDVFSGIRGRFRLENGGGPLAKAIQAVFADQDPLRRLARAEAVALEALLPLWPENPPVELVRIAPYAEALRDLRDTVDAKTSVRDLSNRMGLPETRFPRLFRSLIGLAPKQWLEQVLLDRAMGLLSDPRRTVKDVAYELDFSDEFNFSRFVKRRCGLPPKLLRSRLAK